MRPHPRGRTTQRRDLTATGRHTLYSVCQTAGWPPFAFGRGEESPGSMEVRCRVTPGGGNPRDSATETYRQPGSRLRARRAARVKWCGKSAPRRRQRRRQGKPHREQDQVGTAGRSGREAGSAGRASTPPSGSVARGARQRASQMNGHPPPQAGTEPGLQAVWHFGTKKEQHRPWDDMGITNTEGSMPGNCYERERNRG